MAEPNIDVLLEDPRWEAAGLERWAEEAVQAGLARLGLDVTRFEVAVLGCGDPRIATLNADFRDKPAPTNVLSWPAQDLAGPHPGATPHKPAEGLADMPESLGDVAISYDTCTAEAEAQGKSLADHTRHLVLHGLLHLLGYDHETDEDATVMEKLEAEVLATMGIESPY